MKATYLNLHKKLLTPRITVVMLDIKPGYIDSQILGFVVFTVTGVKHLLLLG